MVLQEAWRTIAIATAGMTLAFLLAVPLSLLAVRALSVSALAGRMNALPTSLRLFARWVMVGLRSVPELIWALVFVRVRMGRIDPVDIFRLFDRRDVDVDRHRLIV